MSFVELSAGSLAGGDVVYISSQDGSESISMSEWYFMEGARSNGPLSFDALVQKVREEAIQGSTLIWSPGFSDWKPASTIAGLFLPPARRVVETSLPIIEPSVAPLASKKEPIGHPESNKQSSTVPSVVGLQAERLARLRVWATVFVCLSIAFACFAAYAAIVYFDAKRLVGSYGYGKVPADDLKVYFWIAENSTFVSIVFVIGMAITGLTTLCMMINTLSQIGVPQRRNPKWSFFSFFIPLWNLYRPWAGIAEVRNTMIAAVKRQEWPENASKGFDLPSLLFGSWFVLLALTNVIEKQIVKELDSRAISPASIQGVLSDLSVLMTVEFITSTLHGVFFGMFVASFLKLYRQFIKLAEQTEAAELAS